MINLFNLKNQLIGYAFATVGIVIAIFKIRKGGKNAERQKHTQATLEAANETIRQDAIVRDGSTNIKRMSNRLSARLRRSDDT